MKILTLSAIIALPFMALGQTNEPQQKDQQQQMQQTQGQTTDTQPAEPAKVKKEVPAQEPANPKAKPETNRDVRERTDVQRHEGRTEDTNRRETRKDARESTNVQRDENRAEDMNRHENGEHSRQTNMNTHVNVQEFRSRHSEVFSLGRHPKEFFIQRYGERHFRLIGNTYFVFVDGCWVAVDVDGFVYAEHVICAGDPEFIAVD
jgi:hypothetical protein